MKIRLFEDMLHLNQAFETILGGLENLERERFFNAQDLRNVRADVECARITANREFFENFEAIVEKDAAWAYKFQREYNLKTKDPEEGYFDIEKSEERRKKKGLPPRVILLPGWDMSDEERYDEERIKRNKRSVRSRRSKDTKNSIPRKTGRR